MDKTTNILTQTEVNGKTIKKVRTVFPEDNPKAISRTQQHFKKEADINHILKKFKKSGLLTDPLHRPTQYPQFGDFTNVTDFHGLLILNYTIQSKQK